METQRYTMPFLLAVFAAVAAMPTNVYQICAWNLGTLDVPPWRARRTTATRRVAQRFSDRLRLFCRDHWLELAAAALVALLAATDAGASSHGHHLAMAAALGGPRAMRQTLVAELERAKADITTVTERAKAAGRELSGEEREQVAQSLDKARQLKARVDAIDGDESMRRAVEALTGGGGRALAPGEYAGGGGSLGDQFMRSDAGRWLLEHRRALPTGTWTSPSSDLVLGGIGATTLDESAPSGGALVVPQYREGIVPLRQRRIFMAQLFAPGEATSNAVTSMVESTFTNAAAPVAEGALKPESTLAFTANTDAVAKIAHWLPLTEEILEDASQLRSYVDARLRLGVNLALDNQLLNGSGVAPNIKGILNRAGLAAAQPRGTDTNADAVMKQIAAIASDFDILPDGIVMHPTNWLTIQLSKDAQGAYVANGGPFSVQPLPMLGGLPVALSSAIPLGTALVGSFYECGQLFIRGPMRVEASNSHQDFFTKNLIAIRAEIRAALAVYRPSCFGTVTGLN